MSTPDENVSTAPAAESKQEGENPDLQKEKKTTDVPSDSGEGTDNKTASSGDGNGAGNAPDSAGSSGEVHATASAAAVSGGGGDDDERSKRVYVGNLSWRTGWQELKDYMKDAGLDVTHAKIIKTPDGRSRGCGIVKFSSVEDAQEAVRSLNDTELNGRQIFVREDREDHAASYSGGGGGDGSYHASSGGGGSAGGASTASNRFSTGEQGKSRRVYVGNLSWDVAWQDLKDHMRQAGEVVHAEVITEYTGRSKGCGICEYANVADAQEAIKSLTDTELKGRMIFVREDREVNSQAAVASGGSHSQNTSVYVWNISTEASWQDLKDHMRKAGNVDSVTILSNSQGESLGCGVVVYQRPQEAMRAIRELHESDFNGQLINVREDRAHHGTRGGGGRTGRGAGGMGSRGRGRGRGGRAHGGYGGRGYGRSSEDGTQLHVGNLSPDTTWRELKDHFRQCGDVMRAEVFASAAGQSKGHGTVQFYNRQDAEAAISRLNGSELQGRALEVRLDQKAH